MFAIDDSASSFCARLMRGTASIAIALALRATSRSSSAAFCPGHRNEISVAPSRSISVSSWPVPGWYSGGRTFATMSCCHTVATSLVISQPASR